MFLSISIYGFLRLAKQPGSQLSLFMSCSMNAGLLVQHIMVCNNLHNSSYVANIQEAY